MGGIIGGIIGGIVFVLIVIVLLRTILLKPTSAKTAKINMECTPRSNEYAQKVSDLIKIETISSRFDPSRDKFYKFHEALETMFPLLHKTCEKKDFNGSLLFRWPGSGEAEPILFMSHQDVVEGTGEWTHDPFSGDIDEEGNIWGRGAVDTKTSLFCMLQALEELIAEGYQPKGDVYIGSSCTEEWCGDGAPATVAYLKEQGVKLSMVLDEGGLIMDEPVGGVKGCYGVVGVVEKGYGDVRFVAHSNGGHASAPVKNTPLVRLGKFMVDVEKHYPFRSEFSETVTEMFKRMAPNMSFGMRLIFANMWLFKPLLVKLLPSISSAGAAMIRTTIAFTTAKGSDGLNVIPQKAYVTGNMRFIQHMTTAECLEIIKKRAAKFDIETQVIVSEEPTPPVLFNTPQFAVVEEVAAEVFPGVGIAPYTMTGGTDAKFYTEICDNCLRFAPIYINKQQHGSIHGLDENIHQGTLPYAVDFYKKVVHKTV